MTKFVGKAFSVLGVADNAIPLVSGVLYSKLYNATIHSHPEAIFYLTMASQVAVFVIVWFVFYVVQRQIEWLIIFQVHTYYLQTGWNKWQKGRNSFWASTRWPSSYVAVYQVNNIVYWLIFICYIQFVVLLGL